MLARRIIPCLDVKDGRVVKRGPTLRVCGIWQTRWRWPGSTTNPGRTSWYSMTSPPLRRAGTCLRTSCGGLRAIFIPLTVGGGIRTLEDFDRVLKCGADKVNVNSGAIADPAIIGAAAKKYGDQCVVLSMDVKRVDGQFRLFAKAAGGHRHRRYGVGRPGHGRRRRGDRVELHRHRRRQAGALTWRCWTPWHHG